MTWPGSVLEREAAYAIALAGLPKLNPGRLRRLLHPGDGVPSAAWGRVLEGDLVGIDRTDSDLPQRWRRHALGIDPAAELVRYRAAGVGIHVLGYDGYPARLADDPEAPAVLFSQGSLPALELPTVAVVGTRRCTGYGRQVAQVLGRQLSERGVTVISGMALGIDSAAQVGALGPRDAPPGARAPVVGVAGSGLDRVYPESSRTLWERLRHEGLLLSEIPLGTGARPRMFPWRNRIMAALADVVVVVESHPSGGSLGTVNSASERGATVMAVPGPITSSASSGTNSLIADGCLVVRDTMDVEVALGLRRPGPVQRPAELADHPIVGRAPAPLGGRRTRPPRRTKAPGPGPTSPDTAGPDALAWRSPGGSPPTREASIEEMALLNEVDATPTPLEVLMARTGRRAGELAVLLDGLEQAGLVVAGPGWWHRRAG